MRRLALTAAALVLAGCGGDDADKTAPFVGPWTVTQGALTGTCAGLPMPINQSLNGGQQTITKTADGALSMTILTGCNIILDVNGTAATLRATMPPQTCTFPFMFMGASLPVMATFTAGSFTVTGDTASFSYTGTASAGILSCMVTGTGMSKKGAAPDGGASPGPDGGGTSPDVGASSPDGGASPDAASTADGAAAGAEAGIDMASSSTADAGADAGSSTD